MPTHQSFIRCIVKRAPWSAPRALVCVVIALSTPAAAVDVSPLEGIDAHFSTNEVGEVVEVILFKGSTTLNDDLNVLRHFPTIEHIDLVDYSGFAAAETMPLVSLPQLRVLRFAGCVSMNEAALQHLAACKALTTLKVPEATTDAGLIPLKVLKTLQSLYLSPSKVTDAGLAELGQLSSLSEIDISETAITDQGLSVLRQCPRLQYVGVPKLATANGFKMLATLGDLRGIGFAGQLSSAGLAHLGDLPQLTSFAGDRCQLTEDVRWGAVGPLLLTDLRLRETNTNDLMLSHVGRLQQLSVLDLSGTRITDAAMEQISTLVNLTELHLDGTAITDKGLYSVGRLTHLRLLSLADLDITNKCVDALLSLSQVSELNIGGTKIVSDGATLLRQRFGEEAVHDARPRAIEVRISD